MMCIYGLMSFEMVTESNKKVNTVNHKRERKTLQQIGISSSFFGFVKKIKKKNKLGPTMSVCRSEVSKSPTENCLSTRYKLVKFGLLDEQFSNLKITTKILF